MLGYENKSQEEGGGNAKEHLDGGGIFVPLVFQEAEAAEYCLGVSSQTEAIIEISLSLAGLGQMMKSRPNNN